MSRIFCILAAVLAILAIIADSQTTNLLSTTTSAPATTRTVDPNAHRAVVRPQKTCPQPFVLTASQQTGGATQLSSNSYNNPRISDTRIRDGVQVFRIISLLSEVAFRPEAIIELRFPIVGADGINDPNSLRFLLDLPTSVPVTPTSTDSDDDSLSVAAPTTNQIQCSSAYMSVYFPNYLNGLVAEYLDYPVDMVWPASAENRSVLSCAFQKVAGYTLRTSETVNIYTAGSPTNDSSCAVSVFIGSLTISADTRDDVANTMNVVGTMAFLAATMAVPIVGVAAVTDLQLYAAVMQSQCSSPYHRDWTNVAKYFVAPLWNTGADGIIGYNILICVAVGIVHFSLTYLLHKLVCLDPRTLIFRMSQTYFPSFTFHCINFFMVGIYYGTFYIFQDPDATTLKALAAFGVVIVITLPIVHAILESARFMRLTFHKCNWGLLESEAINVTREKDLSFAIRMRLAILPRGVFGPPKQLKRFSGVIGPYASRRFIIFDRLFRFIALLFLVALPSVLDCTVVFALFAVSCFLYTFVIIAVGAHRSHVSNGLCACTLLLLTTLGALMGSSVGAHSNMIEQGKVAVSVLILLVSTAHAAFAVVIHYTESNRLEQMKEERRRIDAENAAIAARDGTAAPIIRPRLMTRNNDRDDLTETGTMSVASYYFDDDDDDSSTIGKSEDAQSKFSVHPPSARGLGGGQLVSNNAITANNNANATNGANVSPAVANQGNYGHTEEDSPNAKQRFENGGKGGRDREDKSSRKHRHHRGEDYHQEDEDGVELTEEQIRKAKRREEKRAKKLQEKENAIASREAAQYAKEFPLFAPPTAAQPATPSPQLQHHQGGSNHATNVSTYSGASNQPKASPNTAFHLPAFHPKGQTNSNSNSYHMQNVTVGPHSPQPQLYDRNNSSNTNGGHSPNPYYLGAPMGGGIVAEGPRVSSPVGYIPQGGPQQHFHHQPQLPHQPPWPTDGQRQFQQHSSQPNTNGQQYSYHNGYNTSEGYGSSHGQFQQQGNAMGGYYQQQQQQGFGASQSPFTAVDSPSATKVSTSGARQNSAKARPNTNNTTTDNSGNTTDYSSDQVAKTFSNSSRQYIDDGRPLSGVGHLPEPSPPSLEEQAASFGSPTSAHEVLIVHSHQQGSGPPMYNHTAAQQQPLANVGGPLNSHRQNNMAVSQPFNANSSNGPLEMQRSYNVGSGHSLANQQYQQFQFQHQQPMMHYSSNGGAGGVVNDMGGGNGGAARHNASSGTVLSQQGYPGGGSGRFQSDHHYHNGSDNNQSPQHFHQGSANGGGYQPQPPQFYGNNNNNHTNGVSNWDGRKGSIPETDQGQQQQHRHGSSPTGRSRHDSHFNSYEGQVRPPQGAGQRHPVQVAYPTDRGSPILNPNTSRLDNSNMGGNRFATAQEEHATDQGGVSRELEGNVVQPMYGYDQPTATNSCQPPARMNSFEAAMRANSSKNMGVGGGGSSHFPSQGGHNAIVIPLPSHPPPRVPSGVSGGVGSQPQQLSYQSGRAPGPIPAPPHNSNNNNSQGYTAPRPADNEDDDDDDDDCQLDAFNTLHAIGTAQEDEDGFE